MVAVAGLELPLRQCPKQAVIAVPAAGLELPLQQCPKQAVIAVPAAGPTAANNDAFSKTISVSSNAANSSVV